MTTLQTLDDLERELKALMQHAKDKQLRGTELSYIAVEGVDDETLLEIAKEVGILRADIAQCIARIDEVISQLEQIDATGLVEARQGDVRQHPDQGNDDVKQDDSPPPGSSPAR